MPFVQARYNNDATQPSLEPAERTSQIVCQGCRTLLMYPPGAHNVRCATCSHITHVPPAGVETAQLVCSAPQCRTVLVFPRGAPWVQCGACRHINDAHQANSVGHVVCDRCHVTLMYAHGAQSVRCAVCLHVTPVPTGGHYGAPPHCAPGPVQGSLQPPPAQMVVIENPPSYDEHGNEIQNIVVGVASSGAPLEGGKRGGTGTYAGAG